MSDARPWAPREGGLRLRVKVTPRAKREGIEGIVADADGRPLLAVKVAAPPADGAANKAVVALLSASLRVPKSAIAIEAGASARIKTLSIGGDPGALAGALEALLD